ncbi:MAG: hypothetical protein RL150_203 [Candidatus Parcubacteria bacterium]
MKLTRSFYVMEETDLTMEALALVRALKAELPRFQLVDDVMHVARLHRDRWPVFVARLMKTDGFDEVAEFALLRMLQDPTLLAPFIAGESSVSAVYCVKRLPWGGTFYNQDPHVCGAH